ncbi:hypothetical protein MMC25_000385 [Agyrium rufum]|nr:hypothetical protein [Agyrium rufum]
MNEVVISDVVSTSIQRVRELRNHGRYAEAASDLEEQIQRLGADIRLVIELSETLFIQGFFDRVIKVLDEQLDEHLDACNSQDNLTAASGRLIRCLSHFLATSQFKESLSHVERVYEWFVSSPQSEVINDATVRIEVYHCKFWHLAASCGSFDDLHIQTKHMPRLQKVFNILTQRGDFFNALSVARAHSACSTGSAKNSLIECLATSDRTPLLYRAHAQFLLARSIKTNELREEQDRLYALALKSFEDENHFHGVLDTEIAMTCRLPLNPNDDTFGERIRSLFERYEALNYPTGLSDALLQFLDLAHGLNNLETESLVLHDLESLFPVSTSKLTWLLIRLSTLARRAVRGGDRGKIVLGGEALWKDLIGSDCASIRGQVAQLISQAYSALKDGEMMATWSRRAQDDLLQTNLTAVPSLITGYDLNSIEGLTKCYEMVSILVDPKLTNDSPEASAEKVETFLNQALVRKGQDARSREIIDRAIKMYEENLSRISDVRATPVMLAKLRVLQATMLTLRASSRHDIDLELDALKLLSEGRDLYVQANQLGQAVIVLQREALLNVGIAQKFERIQDSQVRLAWQNAVKQYKIAFDSANALGLVFLASDNAYWVAFCEYRQWAHGWCSPEALLQSLQIAEDFLDRQRQEVSILPGVAAAVVKGRLSSDDHARNIYKFAVRICVGVGNVADAWTWVQKSKARSLSDLLGLGVFVPLKLRERILHDTTCQRLFEEEQRLAENLAAAPDTEQFMVRIRLEKHQETMREQGMLAELLNLREGVPIILDDLFTGSMKYRTRKQHNHTIVFVDWIVIESGLFMYVVKQGENPILRELPISIHTVQTWVSKHLNSENDDLNHIPHETTLLGLQEEDEEEEGSLRDLDILVAPLAELSREDNLLVLCPTGALHAIPLHALRLGPVEDRRILIERNLIAYCASLTSFVQCCRRADSGTPERFSKRLLAVYERELGTENDGHREFSEDERREIYASTKILADYLDGEQLCGEDLTFQSFKESLECADLVHFFGHCDYAPDLSVEQSLRISGEGEGTQPACVTVKDLFDFRIKAAHISLLACASAVQRFQAGDEPLGLVTGFLSAGATSVLGTLWPVQSPTARLFSEYFYTHLLQSAEEESHYRVYDLAYAAREAILDIKKCWEFRQPRHWASFVLHGAWFLKGGLNVR